MPAPAIKTKRLFLRQWTDDDLMQFAVMNADPEVMEYFPALLSTEESNKLAERIRTELQEKEYGFWAVEIQEGASFIGFIGLHRANFDAPFCPCVEIGWRLTKEQWGKGYATEGAKAALDYAFSNLQLPEVLSFTAEVNKRSQKVMKKIGMKHDPSGNFDHPMVPDALPIKPHVLYRLKNPHL
ncbi:MAG: GNAT family N-acetyltransferase [Chlamydiota bacterium]